jgi:amidase
MTEISESSATEIVARLARREMSVREVTEAFLRRVTEFNPALNAIVTPNPRVHDDAQEADRRLKGGAPIRALEGVPFVVKDVVPTKDVRTTFGSLIHEHYVPAEDAVSVERLKNAGAILLGKTNTPEFATDLSTTNKIFGLTRNPVNLNVSVGGSSGGTASAIAADMAPIGIGTDHGGSIRIPAAWSGICGLRTSPGRVAKYPDEYGWDTLVAHVQGPMARTVADAGLMLAVLAGQDDRDPSSLPDPTHDYAAAARTPARMSGRRMAYCGDLGGVVPVDPEVREATLAAARQFEAMGCHVEEATLDASDVRDIIAGTRGFSLVARYGDLVDEYSDRMASQLVGQVSDARKQDLGSLARAERRRTQYWHRVRVVLERFEFILTPTIGAPPFRIDEPLPTHVGGRPVERFYDVLLATYAFSLLGLPALSIPCGSTRDGLPIGLQIVGRRLREDQVLGAGAAYAEARPAHFARRPVPLADAVPLAHEFLTPGMRMR